MRRLPITLPPDSRWIIISEDSPTTNYRQALVRCACGTERWLDVRQLRSGRSKSCGCLRREVLRLNVPHNRTHGDASGHRTRLYRIWRGMISRTENPRLKHYRWYGARGVRVCQEWRHDYAAFKAWAFAHGYADDLSIDRIDSGRGYEPSNCRWITVAENTRRARAEALGRTAA